ncbi:MAG: hypothetical protein JST93_37105 [Acidobacteria bacterium]|nr:hypothetical protein [Acidobacteriota bacterium]
MKAKNKEVNIFNMSLLDILCGALGAFCFMMLVLFQYWKPEGPETVKVKENTAQLEQKVQELLQRMQGMSNVPPEVMNQLRQMQQQFDALKQQVAQLRAMLQQEQARNEALRRQTQQAQGDAESLRKQNEELKKRNPISVVMMTLTPPHEIDLYVTDAKMDPPTASKVQGVKWPGDVYYNSVSHTDVWMMRDTPPGDYKVFYKLMDRKGNASPAIVSGYYMHSNTYVYLPRVEMTQDKQVVFAGTIRVRPDYGTAFLVAPELEALYKQQQASRSAPAAGNN